MKTLINKRQIYDFLVCAGLAACLISLVIFPAESVSAAGDGLTLCINVIVPSLFPFFVLSSMTIRAGLARYLGQLFDPVMRPLFNVGGACSTPFVLGFIGGYPIGAKSVITLYESGDCTKIEAERLLAFCNNSGPAFILGVVGAGIFSSSTIGLMLYLAHAAASVCVGLIFRNWGKTGVRTAGAARKTAKPPQTLAAAFTESVVSSFTSTINICAFVVFFTVIIRLLFLSGLIPAVSSLIGSVFSPLGFDSKWADHLLTGAIELSSGVWSLQGSAAELRGSMAMAAFMLGWAGLSVHFQVISFIGGSGLRVRSYILGKFLHGVISAVFAFLLSKFFTFSSPVSSYLAEQVTGIATLDFSTSASISAASAAVMCALFVGGAVFAAKKGGKP